MLKKSIYFISILAVFMLFSSYARAEVDGEVQYILNTFLFLVSGFLVMWMAAGFAMLESGLVTSKSVATIAAKNIGLYSIAGLMFWLVGYNMAYGIPAGGFIGSPLAWSENIIRSYLEPQEAVVVVDTFRLYKLEEICQATMNWIDQYPHSRFDLSSMRLEFNTGETFAARYVKKSQCGV